MRLTSSKGIKGFLLLEVILSVFIVSVGIVFVIGSFITSIKAFKATDFYAEAVYLLEERMWQYREEGTIEEGKDSGGFEGRKGAQWSVEAEELDELPLNEVKAEVIIESERGNERSISIVTYLFKEEEL